MIESPPIKGFIHAPCSVASKVEGDVDVAEFFKIADNRFSCFLLYYSWKFIRFDFYPGSSAVVSHSYLGKADSSKIILGLCHLFQAFGVDG